MDIAIEVQEMELSDRSHVYNVHLAHSTIHAVSNESAWRLAHAIAQAINTYSVDEAKAREA